MVLSEMGSRPAGHVSNVSWPGRIQGQFTPAPACPKLFFNRLKSAVLVTTSLFKSPTVFAVTGYDVTTVVVGAADGVVRAGVDPDALSVVVERPSSRCVEADVVADNRVGSADTNCRPLVAEHATFSSQPVKA
jgi:hypothetical protein